ncbi:2-amino-4-hydroxy-6-hydroxymethyldihydropteridine diphosphokinase [Rhizobacter sp. J219]|uniref:2-amino-4-hydroxy-6- hydroxymethyldihydropteridine diphosphokinase n=1 Tax=Rhizobacter sp. J219 TaxID=2898430 RepID=UPI0035B3141A
MVPLLAYVGLGANLGDPADTVRTAIEALARMPASRVEAVSALYRSAPIDAEGPEFVNAVVALHTTLSAYELLAQLQAIEAEFGRERPYQNAPRTLDLDLLLYGDREIASDDLTVPHPRMHQRAFVLRPLAELAGDGLVIGGHGSIASLLPLVAAQPITRLETA